MNRLERFIYNRVKNNARLKNSIVITYQTLFALVPTKPLYTQYKVTTREGYFFGFHDKCPWSNDNCKLLAHHYNTPHRLPKPGETVEIGYFSTPAYEQFHPIALSNAWNWQQGAMLQWVGVTQKILFNDFEGNRHIARIADINGEIVDIIGNPIGALSPCGRYGLSYSFERLRHGMPGYGYASGEDPNRDVLTPDNEAGGLKLIDLETKEGECLWTLKTIASLEPEPSMQDAFHFFTHCLFNPSGQRFVFYHRWLDTSGKLWTRMISSNLQGNDLHIFPTNGMVSHISWQDDEHILAYANTKGLSDGYYLFRDKSNTFTRIGQGYFTADGHPQFAPDGHRFITDTYPDRRRVQQLIVFDTRTNDGYEVARFHSPLKFRGELRVDLHPRWNRQGTALCVDSAHTNKRSINVIELTN
jgi:hypothetical protein